MANQKVITGGKVANPNVERWEFKRGHLTLSYSLDIDVKTDLKDWIELLKAGIEATEKELAKFKK